MPEAGERKDLERVKELEEELQSRYADARKQARELVAHARAEAEQLLREGNRKLLEARRREDAGDDIRPAPDRIDLSGHHPDEELVERLARTVMERLLPAGGGGAE